MTIEAHFDVGEYKIMILSATQATGLERWLQDNRYKIPDGAAALLRPYVESGAKFFVAKVAHSCLLLINKSLALSVLTKALANNPTVSRRSRSAIDPLINY